MADIKLNSEDNIHTCRCGETMEASLPSVSWLRAHAEDSFHLGFTQPKTQQICVTAVTGL